MSKERAPHATVAIDGIEQEVASTGQACLVVFYGKNLGRRYFLDKPELIIGRSESADIQVDQESVSRQHAKVVTENGDSTLYDLGSTNGTFVNSQPSNCTSLCDGDLLRVGQMIFKYLSGSNIEGKYHEEIYHLTTIDGLTQAFNKRYFLEAMERELNRSIRYGRTMSLIMFDIDHFKAINDTHGHLAGDYVLREMAGIVKHNVRRQDVFARYGGEEFSLILPEIDKEGAVQVAEKLRHMIEGFEFRFANQAISVTVSLGIRAIEEDDKNVDVTTLIADADARLYEAKQSGRNCVCV